MSGSKPPETLFRSRWRAFSVFFSCSVSLATCSFARFSSSFTLAPCRGLSNQIIPVFLPVHIPDLRNMVFPPDTILLLDSSPFLSVPIYHQPVPQDLLHSEIPYQSISPTLITHICHCYCYILIFPASSNRSPFFTTIKFTATSPSSLSFPYAPYHFLLVYFSQGRDTLL